MHIINDLKKRTAGPGNENLDVHVYPANTAPDHKTMNHTDVVAQSNHSDV
jgi:hypothetical protein